MNTFMPESPVINALQCLSRYTWRWPMVGRCRPERIGSREIANSKAPRHLNGRGCVSAPVNIDTQDARRRRTSTAGVAIISLSGMLAMPVQALDVNTASVEQLESLNGVGPGTAKTIIQERERAGPFESLEDLSDRVRGIGRKRLGRLRAAGLSAGAGVTVFGPNTAAMPQFAPALPAATPIAP